LLFPQVILATNIAETSVTINGIVAVVDSGKVKVRSSGAGGTGMESLDTVDVAQVWNI
jgi:HrpA-like RNA helicase